MNVHQAAELVARRSYGKLIAYLAVRTKDVAAAEDALSEAFLAALRVWPVRGVPTNPEAWLLVSARRKVIDSERRHQTQTRLLSLMNLAGFHQPEKNEETLFPDERLKLLFVCTHPAIDRTLHTPLMLQTVLGLNAAQIGSAFLVAPTTIGQRLVRAKAKIKHAGIPFDLPAAEELMERSQAVLEAIYAAYNQAWSSSADTAPARFPNLQSLTAETLLLARLCIQLIPDEPEAYGLLALILYCESRCLARQDLAGQYIPLLKQDTTLWSRPMINEAEQHLKRASTYQRFGRFQLEAAIQSVHAQRTETQQTDWQTLAQLYEALIERAPTVGAMLGYVCVIAQTQGPKAALSFLHTLPIETIQNHQPYWATKAALLKQSGQTTASRRAYSCAIKLTKDSVVRAFLTRQLSQ